MLRVVHKERESPADRWWDEKYEPAVREERVVYERRRSEEDPVTLETRSNQRGGRVGMMMTGGGSKLVTRSRKGTKSFARL